MFYSTSEKYVAEGVEEKQQNIPQPSWGTEMHLSAHTSKKYTMFANTTCTRLSYIS